ISSGAIFKLGKAFIGTSMPKDFGVDFPDDTWRTTSFWVYKDDLGGNPTEIFGDEFRIWLMKRDVGSWMLAPKIYGQPTWETVNQRPCPECFGSGRVVDEKEAGATDGPDIAAAEVGEDGKIRIG